MIMTACGEAVGWGWGWGRGREESCIVGTFLWRLWFIWSLTPLQAMRGPLWRQRKPRAGLPCFDSHCAVVCALCTDCSLLAYELFVCRKVTSQKNACIGGHAVDTVCTHTHTHTHTHNHGLFSSLSVFEPMLRQCAFQMFAGRSPAFE